MAAMSTTAPETLPLAPGRWALDTAHSSVGFAIRHLGVSKVRGRFQEFDVDVVVGPTLAETSVVATIEMASIDTGNADRDAHVPHGRPPRRGAAPDDDVPLDVDRRPPPTAGWSTAS